MLFFRFACGGLFDLARPGGLNRLQAAFHFRIGNPCGTLRRIAQRRVAGATLGRTCLGHHNALALGFDDDVLGPPVAETLFHIPRTRATAQAQCLYRLYRSSSSSILPDGPCHLCVWAQTLQPSGFLYNTLRESTRGERPMYHSLTSESQTQFIRA